MENLLVKLINSGGLLFLYFFLIGSVWFSLIRNLDKENESIDQIKKRILTIILLIIISIIIITILASYLLQVKTIFFDDENAVYDISNWITLIVEIAIGFSIAIIILIYSRFKEREDRDKDREKIVEATVKKTLESTGSATAVRLFFLPLHIVMIQTMSFIKRLIFILKQYFMNNKTMKIRVSQEFVFILTHEVKCP